MKLLQKLFSDRGVREKWDAGLIWFRLRYREADGPTRCIKLLSRPQACGRVALYHRPGEKVSQLYLGVPETHVRLLQRMAADFGFSLKPKSLAAAIPVAQRMTAVPDLPWDKPFVAHIVNECAFVSLVDSKDKTGLRPYLPQLPSTKQECDPVAWHLPDEPLPGLTVQPSWNGRQPPAQLVADEPDPRRWLLGRSQSGVPLHVAGRVNIYGRREAVADWLVHQVAQMVAVSHANLVVIDGAGDLVPKLKRKAAITRLLGERLAYVDIDGVSLTNGFNPLAAAPGETEEATALRWQRWFQGMNVHPQGIQLLAPARQDGVADIPSLRKWLKQAERTGQYTAVSSLGLVLNRLTANRSLREWLEWPANRFDVLPEGALFFAVKGTDWARQQLLRAVLLGALPVRGVRLIVHGFPWKGVDLDALGGHDQLVISNGPLLPHSAIILTESHPQGAAKLAGRFLAGDGMLSENLSLLVRGEGIVIADGTVFFTTWNNRHTERDSGNS
ncbi:MAG TPA: hypothetical protein EYH05_08565 [Anaerolineae bacterium]|nr:hypothetical protein [Anaerolineae bacterium]